jgi:hypothetical protein
MSFEDDVHSAIETATRAARVQASRIRQQDEAAVSYRLEFARFALRRGFEPAPIYTIASEIEKRSGRVQQFQSAGHGWYFSVPDSGRFCITVDGAYSDGVCYVSESDSKSRRGLDIAHITYRGLPRHGSFIRAEGSVSGRSSAWEWDLRKAMKAVGFSLARGAVAERLGDATSFQH